jgi:hypothetical protein
MFPASRVPDLRRVFASPTALMKRQTSQVFLSSDFDSADSAYQGCCIVARQEQSRLTWNVGARHFQVGPALTEHPHPSTNVA